VIKLEEQKSDLERQLKTLTKQIKVSEGYSPDRSLLHPLAMHHSHPKFENIEKIPHCSVKPAFSWNISIA
jgi:hypothetical protein